MLPDFPASKQAVRKHLQEYFEGRVRFHSGGLMHNVPSRIMHEGEVLVTEHSTDFIQETPLHPIISSTTISIEKLLRDTKMVYGIMDEMAIQTAEQQSKIMFETISDITERTGNVLRRNGEMSIETILLMYEKVEMDFDIDGKPILPSIIVSPNDLEKTKLLLEKLQTDSEAIGKFEKVIEDQRIKWNDRQNNRELVG